MHEMEHGLGVIPYSTQWYYQVLRENVDGSGRGTGHWLGDRVTEALSFWDNVAFEQLNGDYQHMWPYGINGAHEDTGAETLYLGNAMICQALGEDGLEHTNNHFADHYYAIDHEDDVKYYLKNEDDNRGADSRPPTSCPTPAARCAEVASPRPGSSRRTTALAWTITFTPGNPSYQFRKWPQSPVPDLQRQRLQDRRAHGAHAWRQRGLPPDEGARRREAAAADPERGYWLIHPTNNWTPPCLTASATQQHCRSHLQHCQQLAPRSGGSY